MITPTRMELTKTKKKLVTAMRGHKLLKDKRDELMRRFLETVNECRALREKVEESLKISSEKFVVARAEMSEESVNTALCAPKYEFCAEAELQNVMSVNIPVINMKFYNNVPSYGYAFTSDSLDDAVKNLSDIMPDLLLLAQKEHACRLMADEIEKTRRRVNALEHVTIPKAQEDIKYITMKLSENERANQIRLMKVKDMMIADAIKKAHSQNV